MSDATKSGDAPAKVRAPRKAKGTAEKVAAPKLPLTLPKPTTSNGSANATLSGTVEKKFSRIVLRNKAGADIVVIHSTKEGEKALNPGAATVNYIYALVDSVLAGQGAGPDGSAMYAADNWTRLSSTTVSTLRRTPWFANPQGERERKVISELLRSSITKRCSRLSWCGRASRRLGLLSPISALRKTNLRSLRCGCERRCPHHQAHDKEGSPAYLRASQGTGWL